MLKLAIFLNKKGIKITVLHTTKMLIKTVIVYDFSQVLINKSTSQQNAE